MNAAHPAHCAVLTLPEVLDLKAASKLATDLISMRKQELVIDASQVRRVGGQCLQVLLAAIKTWAADRHRLELTNPSPEFIEGTALLGAPLPSLFATS